MTSGLCNFCIHILQNCWSRYGYVYQCIIAWLVGLWLTGSLQCMENHTWISTMHGSWKKLSHCTHPVIIMTKFRNCQWYKKFISFWPYVATIQQDISFTTDDYSKLIYHKFHWMLGLAGRLWAWTPFPDNKVHEANMGAIWGRQDPGGPHVGPINFAIWVVKTVHIRYLMNT